MKIRAVAVTNFTKKFVSYYDASLKLVDYDDDTCQEIGEWLWAAALLDLSTSKKRRRELRTESRA